MAQPVRVFVPCSRCKLSLYWAYSVGVVVGIRIWFGAVALGGVDVGWDYACIAVSVFCSDVLCFCVMSRTPSESEMVHLKGLSFNTRLNDLNNLLCQYNGRVSAYSLARPVADNHPCPPGSRWPWDRPGWETP